MNYGMELSHTLRPPPSFTPVWTSFCYKFEVDNRLVVDDDVEMFCEQVQPLIHCPKGFLQPVQFFCAVT